MVGAIHLRCYFKGLLLDVGKCGVFMSKVLA